MADRKNIVGGVVAVYIDGVRLRVKDEVEVMHGNEDVQPVVGADEVHGFSATPQAPGLKFKTTDASDLDVKALLSKRNVTVFVEKPNGKGIVLSEAAIGGGRYTSKEGEIELEAWGLRLEEV